MLPYLKRRIGDREREAEFGPLRPGGGQTVRGSDELRRLARHAQNHRRRACVALDALRRRLVANHIGDEVRILDKRRRIDEPLRHPERTRVLARELQATRVAAHHLVPAFDRGMQRILHERPRLRQMPVAAGTKRRQHERRATLRVVGEEIEHALVGQIGDAPVLPIDPLLEFDGLDELGASGGRFKPGKKILERDRVVPGRLLRESRHDPAERGFKGAGAQQLFAARRLHPRGPGERHRAAVDVEHRNLRVVDRLAATIEVFAKKIGRVIEHEEALRAMLGGVLQRAQHGRRLAAFGNGDERVPFADVERGGLAATAFRKVLEELDAADERKVAARHDGGATVGQGALGGRQLGGAAVEEVAPHRFQENGETACRAAAGEDDAGKSMSGGVEEWRSFQGLDHRIHELGELLAGEDVAHGDGNLPIAALKALHTRKRRALEVLLQRRRYRVGLFRGQKAQMELLLVVDEIARLRLGGIRAVERQGHTRKQSRKC